MCRVKAPRFSRGGHGRHAIWRHGGGRGIPGVVVKCVDIGRNTEGEGSLLGLS